MEGEQEGKKDEKETDYRRLQSYPLIRVSELTSVSVLLGLL